VAKFSFTAFTTASRALRALVRSKKKKPCLDFSSNSSSRERFSEILQNFRSAGYMPSARSILLLLLAAASLRSRNPQKSSHDFRFIVLYLNLKSNLQILLTETRILKT